MGGRVRSSYHPDFLAMSRRGLEGLLRRLVKQQCSEIQFICGTVFAIVTSSDKKSVQQIKYRTRDNSGLTEVVMDVNFLVDCTGATSAGQRWLKSAGCPEIPKIVYWPFVHYASILFQTTEAFRDSPWPFGATCKARLLSRSTALSVTGPNGPCLIADTIDPDRPDRKHGIFVMRNEGEQCMLVPMRQDPLNLKQVWWQSPFVVKRTEATGFPPPPKTLSSLRPKALTFNRFSKRSRLSRWKLLVLLEPTFKSTSTL
jgi:hypothetical protein